MNKNHMNSSMNNYLINASLFKNNQKNRMVSSYVSHRNYFAEETPKNRNQMNIPNVTQSKRQQIILQNDSVQLREVQENKNDALQATVKKDVSNQPFLQNSKKQNIKVAQPILIKQELPSIKQVSKDSQEVITNQLEKQKQIQRKLQIEKEQQILRQKQIERQKQLQKLIENQVQRQIELERQAQLAKEREKEKKELQRKSFHPFNEQKQQSKIIVRYSQKGKSRKLQDKDVQNFNRQLSKNNQNKYNQHHSKYMQYNKQQQQEQEYQQSQVNPYLPTTEKKHRQTTKQPTPKHLSSSKKSLSIHPAFSLIRQMPRQSPINNKPQKESQVKNEQIDHMVNIRKDMSGYLASVKQKLNNSYICLQTVQYDFQRQIEKALQSQCERLKLTLYGLIDQQINGFKEFERREFSKSKFYFMSDLYEIKCNIDLRLQEIQHYQLQLKNQYKWKQFANNIVGINYNQNINFILKKSDQIQNQLASNANPQLNYYAKSLNEEFIADMRKVIKEQFGKVYQNFDKNKFKSKPLTLKERQ